VPRTWQCMGSIRDMYGYNLEHPGGLLGPDYVELWVMRNYHRGCDLYMRRSTVIPREQFSHFSINVSDPAFFCGIEVDLCRGDNRHRVGGCRSISSIECKSSGVQGATMRVWQTWLPVQH